MSRAITDSESNLYNRDSQPHFTRKKTKVVTLRLGPEKKKYLAQYPNLNYYRREILARRLLHFNHVIGFKPAVKKPGSEAFTTYNLDWCKSNPGLTIPRKYKIRPVLKKPEVASKKEEPETDDEKWQRQKFVKRMRQDATSSNVYEVLVQGRLAACTRKDLGMFEYQKRHTIYLETLRAAMNTHDWVLACKSAEGVAEDMTHSFTLHIVWTGGFLATVNLLRNDTEKLLEFAEATRKFCPYSHRAGVEIATWFTQKGAFLDGYNFLKAEMGRVKPTDTYYRTQYFRLNMKRKLLDVVVDLFEAVYHYSCYKNEQKEVDTTDADEVEHLHQLGQNALNHFERLLSQAMESDFDVTIFIEPLIELLVQFRSKEEAKETFKRVCERYFGNGVLDELYLKFLRTYFPARRKEIRNKEKKYKRFQFEINTKEKFYHEQILRRYLEEKSVGNTKVAQVPLRKLPLPAFGF